MNLAQVIGPQLGYLRRFARALTGTQNGGDAYVAAMLETLVADPSLFKRDHDARVECYRLLCAIWDSLSVNHRAEQASAAWEATASRRLDAITPRARQAFLLSAVEGFKADDIAVILNESIDEVRSLLNEASLEITNQVKTDVLIIEDEPLIALDIETLVSDLGHNVTGVARTHKQAVQFAKSSPPGMVLADIQLADGSSGIEAVNEILQTFNVPVIFITAYPERLLTGERPEPAFLITKPFLPEMVKAVMSQALFFETKAGAEAA